MAFTLKDIGSTYELSGDGTLTIGTELLGGFKSGTLSFSAESTDNGTRDDKGWARSTPGKRSAQLQVTFNKMTSNACQAGIRSYVLHEEFHRKGVDVVYRTESNETAPGDGFSGTFVLSNYEESTQEEGSGAVECSATFDSWGPITPDNAVSTGNGN